jgi:hypothetical protein
VFSQEHGNDRHMPGVLAAVFPPMRVDKIRSAENLFEFVNFQDELELIVQSVVLIYHVHRLYFWVWVDADCVAAAFRR